MPPKKTKGPVRKVVRELQLIVSVGAVLLVLYAIMESSLAMALVGNRPEGASGTVLAVVVVHGTLALLAAGLAFGTRLIVDLDPWRLGIGSAVFAKLALLLLKWVTGAFDDGGFLAGAATELVIGLLIGVIAALAARLAASRVAARVAAQPTPASTGPDLGEQLRAVQDAARAPQAAPPEAPVPPEPDKP